MPTPVPVTTASGSTAVSAAASYCTATLLFTFFDVRIIADLLSDTGTPIGVIADTDPIQVDPVVVAANTDLAKMLKAASGKLESAVLIGGRYTPGDLILLTGADPARAEMADANQAYLIAEIVAGIVIPMLYRRRPNITMPKLDIVEDSKEYLAALANGMAVLGLQQSIDAGRAEEQIETVVDVARRNEASWQARRAFGRRAKWDSPLYWSN